MTGPATIFDKPNTYIGQPTPRADAARLLQGRGRFVDDLQLPRMVHAAFFRSPHAHARILEIDDSDALALPGVHAVIHYKNVERVIYASAGRCVWVTRESTSRGRCDRYDRRGPVTRRPRACSRRHPPP